MVSPSKTQQQKDHKALSRDSTNERKSKIRLTKGDKPLLKKTFYLDIKNHGLCNKLETKIKNLGGIIEVFLGKSVTLVVSDRVEQSLNCDKQKWAYTSGGSGGPPSLRSIEPQTPTRTPTTSSLNGECPLSNSTNTRGQTGQRTKSRVDAMLERALTQPQKCSVDPLDNASNWGIPIWTTDKLQAWLEKIYLSLKESANFKCINNNPSGTDNNKDLLKVKDLKKPYIKFESFKRETRPVFLELAVWPTLNFDGEFGTCPFDRKKNIINNKSDKKIEMTRRSRTTTATTRARRSEQLVAGYCEICRIDYKDLTKHVQSDKHLEFVKNDDNFLSLDTLIHSGASVEAFLKLNQPENGQDLYAAVNDDNSIHEVVMNNEKINNNKSGKTEEFHVDELKMVQCNGARRKLNLKLSSSHNLRTRTKHESGHLLRSKGSPWHESDNKNEKFYDKFDGYTIKKRSKGTIWIEEEDTNSKSEEEEEEEEEEEKEEEEKKEEDNKNLKSQINNEKIPLAELNDAKLKTKELRCNNQKKSSSLTRWEERNSGKDKKKSDLSDEQEKNQIENELNLDVNELSKKPNDDCNPKLSELNEKTQKSPRKQISNNNNNNNNNNNISVQKQNESISIENLQNNNELSTNNVDNNDSKNIKLNKQQLETVKKDNNARVKRFNHRRSIRSARSRQRLSVEERLIEDNRAYYKVEVLGSKLRSNAQGNNSQTIQVPVPEKRDREKEKEEAEEEEEEKDEAEEEVKKVDDGPSSEKPVVVRFKRVRKSELSLLSDEAESFMFGDSRRDETTDSQDEDDDETSALPKETSSSDQNKNSSEVITTSSLSSPIKEEEEKEEEAIDDDSQDSVYMGRARKRRRTQAEVFINDNADYYKFEATGSRLRFQGQIADKKLRENIINNDAVVDDDGLKLINKNNEEPAKEIINIEKLYPSKPSDEIEKMNFSFEIVPKSEPWYQTYQRQDDGAEYWHYFSDCDDRKPFLLPYEIDNFHENLRNILNKNNEKRKKSRGRNGFVRLPRKSPRCHASTLAIMSTIIRKKEQQQQQQQKNNLLETTATIDNTIEKPQSRTNTPKPSDKSSTDFDLQQIVKSIDDMLNAEPAPNDSFEPEMTIDTINQDYDLINNRNINLSGPPDNLLDLLETCHQHVNTLDNSSCASSDCGGEIIIESSSSPLKRRKRRKNRTGWPGNKIRKKLQIIKQNKELLLSLPDVDSERENLPTKNQINVHTDEHHEDYEEFSNDIKINKDTVVCERLQGAVKVCGAGDNVDTRTTKCNNVSNECQSVTEKSTDDEEEEEEEEEEEDDDDDDDENNSIDENHENLFRQDSNIKKMLNSNNKSSSSSSSSSSTTASETASSTATTMSSSSTSTSTSSCLSSPQKNRKDYSQAASSSSSTNNSQAEIENNDTLFRKKSTIISRKNYTNNITNKKNKRETIGPIATNGHDNNDKNSTDDSSCKSSDYKKKSSIVVNKNRKKQRKNNNTNYDSENYDKKDTIKDNKVSNVVATIKTKTTTTTELRQRRSSMEFQPVVRVMKIDEQVDIDHNILSVTVASNRRLRSSTSPRSHMSPPKKRFKRSERSRGTFGQWTKNS